MAKKSLEMSKRSVAALNRIRDEKGKFIKNAVLPPSANVNPSSNFQGIPNPIGVNSGRGAVYYNPSLPYRINWQNAVRMLLEPAIYMCLQERQLPTSLLEWNIVPKNDTPEENYAAKVLKELIEETPHWTEFVRQLLESIWWGRAACYVQYGWRFYNGRKRMVIDNWTPINSDSLVFSDVGLQGYLVGAFSDPKKTYVSVEGRFQEITPDERQCWILNQYQRVAGSFNQLYSAGAIFGFGLQSRLYGDWLIRGQLVQNLCNLAEKFGNGFILAKFQMGNEQSLNAMTQALQDQEGASTILIPVSAPDGQLEDLEVVDPPNGMGELLKQIEYFDKQIRLTICGEELTATSKATGLGSNLADVHQAGFSRYCHYDALNLQNSLTKDLVRPMQEWNGFSHLPPMKFEFSFDLDTPGEKLSKAVVMQSLGFPVDRNEIYKASGYAIPDQKELDKQQADLEERHPHLDNADLKLAN